MRHSVGYTLAFATAICVVCGLLVSTSAVSLADRQKANVALDKRKNVLLAAGLITADDKLTRDQINERFDAVKAIAIDLATGEPAEGIDPLTFDQQKEMADPATSTLAQPNPAQVKRLPNHSIVFQVMDDAGKVKMLVLPIEGKGLWSTLYGFLALDADLETIRGLTFYQHGETPGLGGEVDNPLWKSLWPGRKAFDESGKPVIAVIKGSAGPPSEDPHHVDGLSGATITSRGVTSLLQFWLGEHGFGPYIEKFRASRPVS
jgi:Na+-transporting NADH:ubiquinone oxidoreductase subunit C